jgi:hypothetical protein
LLVAVRQSGRQASSGYFRYCAERRLSLALQYPFVTGHFETFRFGPLRGSDLEATIRTLEIVDAFGSIRTAFLA